MRKIRAKKICVFTGSRAEYGLLKPLLEKIKEEPDFSLQILVSGMHLSPEFGLTFRDIEEDGFEINEKVEILLSSDSFAGMSKSIGLGIISFTDSLLRLNPDMVLILGDRFEALACAISAYTLRIPILHLYGGETTEGSLDDGYRNAISQLSTIDFTSTEVYREKLIRKGKSEDRVFNVGALGIDNIRKIRLLSKSEVEKKLGIKFSKRNFLITYHPETKKGEVNQRNFEELLKVLAELRDIFLIFTASNADSEGRLINSMINDFVTKNRDKSVKFTNLGQLFYLSVMKHVTAVIGNSSSGIIEAPSLKVPTINIGDRQKGRVKAKSIIDCEPEYHKIKEALNLLNSKEFNEQVKRVQNPYGDGRSADRIVKILKSLELKNVN